MALCVTVVTVVNTPPELGNPVALVKVPDAGVPRAGVVNVGEVKVLFVKVCVAPKVTTVSDVEGNVIVVPSVPAKVNELLAVKVLPEATKEVTPDSGKPVALVNVPDVGVPRIGVINVGEVAKTKFPLPVEVVIADARLALDGVARNVATPEAGVPNAGVTKVMLVHVPVGV